MKHMTFFPKREGLDNSYIGDKQVSPLLAPDMPKEGGLHENWGVKYPPASGEGGEGGRTIPIPQRGIHIRWDDD